MRMVCRTGMVMYIAYSEINIYVSEDSDCVDRNTAYSLVAQGGGGPGVAD